MNNYILGRRNFAIWLRRCMSTQPAQGPATPSNAGTTNIPNMYRPSEFQKIILVWTKKYKSKAEIPPHVSLDLIERSRSQARIKVANYMILLTALASFGAVLSGKAAAKRGASIETINQEFHQQYRQDYEKQHAQK